MITAHQATFHVGELTRHKHRKGRGVSRFVATHVLFKEQICSDMQLNLHLVGLMEAW
jgi:hypothetical protein